MAPAPIQGTFDYFTEAVVGKAKSSRGDYTASEDDNVLVQGVGGDRNALGYIPFAYVAENEGKLKVVEIDGGNGTCVSPSAQTVQDGTYTPLSRPLFIYVSTKGMEKPAVQEFVEFYLREGGALATEVAYTALPEEAYRKAMERFARQEDGHRVRRRSGGRPQDRGAARARAEELTPQARLSRS